MKRTEIQQFIDRNPFRKFAVRLSNGKLYQFHKAKDLGAAKDLHALIYFDDNGSLILIDTENIVEIIDDPNS